MAKFELPALPITPRMHWSLTLTKKPVEIHHGRHHKTYVDKLNGALEGQAANLQEHRSKT